MTLRSASKVSEKIREQKSVKVIEEFEEKNEHGFDNTQGAEHVIGIYQWVDKIYEAQVFNYGKRMLFDIMAPEPASFYIAAQLKQQADAQKLVKPDPFTLRPDQLTESNYTIYVQKYGATGIDPLPRPYVTVSKGFDERSQNEDSSYLTKSAELPIPSGYQAVGGTAEATFTMWKDDAAIDVLVASFGTRIDKNSSWRWSFGLNNEVDSIPVAVKTFHTGCYVAIFEISCQRTSRAVAEWQLKTHAAILQAYQKLQQDYDEKLAAQEAAALVRRLLERTHSPTVRSSEMN